MRNGTKTYQESGVNIFLYTYYDKSKKDNIREAEPADNQYYAQTGQLW